MPTRFLCQTCGNAQRKGASCRRCGMPAYAAPMSHTGSGVAMWVLAALGGICIPLAFVVSGLLILVAVALLGIAVGLNVADDRALDRQAARRAEEWAAQTPRCPTCGTALAFNPAASRWFCPNCQTYVGPPVAQAPIAPAAR